jgi:PAS domain S-box-containing protein
MGLKDMSDPGSPSSELLDVLGKIGPHEHLALIYESKEEQFAAAIPAIRIGLERREKCVYVADDNTSDDVIDALREEGIDVDAAIKSGSLTVATKRDTTLKERRLEPDKLIRFWADAADAATAAGFSGLRIVAEMTWALHGDPGTDRLIEFEAMVNDLVRDYPIVGICQYNRRRFAPEVMLNVIRVHPLVFFDGLLCRNPYYIPPQEFLGRHHAEMEVERLLGNLRDRKQAEDRVRLVIDAIPTMAWSLQPDGAVDFVNQRWLDYTGISFEDAMTGPNRIVHPEDLSRVMEKWLKDMAAGKPSEDEMRLRRADGEYRWFLIRTVPQLDEEGKIVKWYGTSTDIEDRKRVEEALRKSEKLFAVFMDQLPGFAWMKDIEGRYVYVNKRESELDAYRAGVIGKTDAELWPAEIAAVYRANDRQVITTRKALQTVEPSLADGEQCYMLVSKFPIFDQNGSVVMVAGAGVDITDRIQAEEALRESEARTRLLIKSSNIGLWDWNLVTNDVFYSPEWKSQLGYANDELPGRYEEWESRLHPDDRESALRAVQDFREGRREVYDIEFRLHHKDGSWRSILARADLIRDAAGQPVRMLGCHIDITERKQAEAALRESQARFQSFMDHTPAMVIIKDAEGRYVYLNKTVENRVHATRDELLGRTNFDRLPHETARQLRANDLEVLATGQPHEFIESVPSPGGQMRHWLTSKFPIENAARETLLGVVAFDITERMQAEADRARLAAIIEATPDLVGFADSHQQFRYMNRAMRQALVIADDVDFTQFTIRDVLAPESFEQFSEEILPTVLRDGSWSGESVWLARDGRLIPVSEALIAHKSANGLIESFSTSARDITDPKQTAKELEEANHQLRLLSQRLFEVQEEERRHLARELHDEIGQTLTAAKLNLRIIAPEVPPAAASRLEDSIQILARLLQQVRQLSLDLRPPLLDELGLVPALRWLADQQAQRAGLRVTFTANVEGVEIDPPLRTACFRVAQEAITNAIRHAHAATVAVELRAEADGVWLVVRDDGVGFDKNAMQQRASRGASVGLLSMNERVSLLAGEMEVDSAPGRGTEVRAWFPLAPPGSDVAT